MLTVGADAHPGLRGTKHRGQCYVPPLCGPSLRPPCPHKRGVHEAGGAPPPCAARFQASASLCGTQRWVGMTDVCVRTTCVSGNL